MSDRIPLTCSTKGCHAPFAYIENGCLVVESRHHGEKHTNVMALSTLVKQSQDAGGPVIAPGLVGYHDVSEFYED